MTDPKLTNIELARVGCLMLLDRSERGDREAQLSLLKIYGELSEWKEKLFRYGAKHRAAVRLVQQLAVILVLDSLDGKLDLFGLLS